MSSVAPCSDFCVTTRNNNSLLTNNSLLILKSQCVLLLTFSGADSVSLSAFLEEFSQLVESGEKSGVVSFTGLHFDSDPDFCSGLRLLRQKEPQAGSGTQGRFCDLHSADSIRRGRLRRI